MKFKFLILIFIVVSGTASAQFFERVKPPTRVTRQITNSKGIMASISGYDTLRNQFRPVANIASYLIGKDVKEASIIFGTGLSYQHLKYSTISGRWSAVWSINALAYGRVALGNDSNGKKLLYGVSIGALDNLIMVGFATDGINGYGTMGIGIPLNNL